MTGRLGGTIAGKEETPLVEVEAVMAGLDCRSGCWAQAADRSTAALRKVAAHFHGMGIASRQSMLVQASAFQGEPL
jgi:hypothetical protein